MVFLRGENKLKMVYTLQDTFTIIHITHKDVPTIKNFLVIITTFGYSVGLKMSLKLLHLIPFEESAILTIL